MWKYLVKRLLQIVFVIYIYTSICFLLFYAMPGNITSMYATNPNVKPAMRAKLIEQLGLNQPLYKQYLTYMDNVFIKHQFGVSFSHYPTPVWTIIKRRLPRTFVLFFTATIIAFYVGFTWGKIIAWKRGGVLEYSATLVGVGLWTVFTPMWGLLLIWLFAFKLGWFPINQFLTPGKWLHTTLSSTTIFNHMLLTAVAASLLLFLVYSLTRRLIKGRSERAVVNFSALAFAIGAAWWAWSSKGTLYLGLDILSHMIVPIITLTTISFGGTMLLMRDSMLETVKEDYITTAKAKGLPDRVIRDRHAARTALLPVVTSFVLSIAFAVDGGVITETIFSWPGIGMTLLSATVQMDYPLAIGTFVFTGIFVLFAHLVADILYAYLDPRIKY